MALIACPECQHQISDKAPHCINCGAPAKPGMAEHADGTTVTTQQTGKAVKMQQLLAAVCMVVGSVGVMATASSYNKSNSVFFGLMAFVGLIWWIVARISGWWRHG